MQKDYKKKINITIIRITMVMVAEIKTITKTLKKTKITTLQRLMNIAQIARLREKNLSIRFLTFCKNTMI